MQYSYQDFFSERNPQKPLDSVEYQAMRVNLNRFMRSMLKTLRQEDGIFGQAIRFKTGLWVGFWVAALAATAGVLFLEAPLWIGLCFFCAVILWMSVLAVVVNHGLDSARYRRSKDRFIGEVKSYYMYHYSLMRNAEGYEGYCESALASDLALYDRYLKKYG